MKALSRCLNDTGFTISAEVTTMGNHYLENFMFEQLKRMATLVTVVEQG